MSLYSYVGGIIRGEKGSLIEIGGTSDHVHILAGFSAALSVSEMMKRFKGKSSKWVNKEKKIKQRFQWQEGYGAFTVSQSHVPSVHQYIQKQEDHHKTKTFEEEFILLFGSTWDCLRSEICI